MNRICSNKHKIFTEEVIKKALSRKDDKRKIMEDGIHTKAYEHYSMNVISQIRMLVSSLYKSVRLLLLSSFIISSLIMKLNEI